MDFQHNPGARKFQRVNRHSGDSFATRLYNHTLKMKRANAVSIHELLSAASLVAKMRLEGYTNYTQRRSHELSLVAGKVGSSPRMTGEFLRSALVLHKLRADVDALNTPRTLYCRQN